MTLGGLALAVGILVDDATVDHREHRAPSARAATAIERRSWTARPQIAVPALVSTLCICIVFLPMFFLGGVARYLFVPLAEAVIFAMLASYVLSRTLVPTLAMYLLKPARRGRGAVAEPARPRGSARSTAASSASARAYRGLLTTLVGRRVVFIPVFLGLCLAAFLLAPLARRRTSSRTPTAGSSACTCAPRPAPASRRPRGWPTWSRTRSGARSRPRSWT